MREDRVCQPGEWIADWLLRCRDTEGLEGKETQKLCYFHRDQGIDKEVGREATIPNLWRWLLLSMKARYALRGDLPMEVDHHGEHCCFHFCLCFSLIKSILIGNK